MPGYAPGGERYLRLTHLAKTLLEVIHVFIALFPASVARVVIGIALGIQATANDMRDSGSAYFTFNLILVNHLTAS
jgi:hypothetical protein